MDWAAYTELRNTQYRHEGIVSAIVGNDLRSGHYAASQLMTQHLRDADHAKCLADILLFGEDTVAGHIKVAA